MLPKFPVTSTSGFSSSFCISYPIAKYIQTYKICKYFGYLDGCIPESPEPTKLNATNVIKVRRNTGNICQGVLGQFLSFEASHNFER
jgi:hypothetical protein